jgi:hypothetical protein
VFYGFEQVCSCLGVCLVLWRVIIVYRCLLLSGEEMKNRRLARSMGYVPAAVASVSACSMSRMAVVRVGYSFPSQVLAGGYHRCFCFVEFL